MGWEAVLQDGLDHLAPSRRGVGMSSRRRPAGCPSSPPPQNGLVLAPWQQVVLGLGTAPGDGRTLELGKITVYGFGLSWS